MGEAKNDDNELAIEYPELGVCVEQGTWPFSDLVAFDRARDAATVSELPSRGSAFIMWGRAVWDGSKVDVACRCEADRVLAGAIKSGGESRSAPVTNWNVDANGRLHSAHVPWVDSKHPPSLVRLTCEQEVVTVPVFDERLGQDRANTLPPEVDEKRGPGDAR